LVTFTEGKQRLRVFVRTECWGRYLDLRGRKKQDREKLHTEELHDEYIIEMIN